MSGNIGQTMEKPWNREESFPPGMRKVIFVDDENSKDLFLGYATAGKKNRRISFRKPHSRGSGASSVCLYTLRRRRGAGGITFGLKEIYGDHVHCFFAEPVQAPCMLLGMSTGLHDRISVEDVGLTGKTQADGLAVGRPSAFVGKVMEPLLSGAVTVEDEKLYRYMKELAGYPEYLPGNPVPAQISGSLWESGEVRSLKHI